MAEQTATGQAGKVRPEVRVIEAIVASAFGLSVEALHGDSRGAAAVAFARQVAMYLAHTRLV